MPRQSQLVHFLHFNRFENHHVGIRTLNLILEYGQLSLNGRLVAFSLVVAFLEHRVCLVDLSLELICSLLFLLEEMLLLYKSLRLAYRWRVLVVFDVDDLTEHLKFAADLLVKLILLLAQLVCLHLVT